VGTILNGVFAPLSVVPLFGWGFFFGILPSLLVGSFVNTFLAALLHRALTRR
jgi:hypothetical protein